MRKTFSARTLAEKALYRKFRNPDRMKSPLPTRWRNARCFPMCWKIRGPQGTLMFPMGRQLLGFPQTRLRPYPHGDLEVSLGALDPMRA